MRRSSLLFAMLIAACALLQAAQADNAWFSLNLEFNNPANFNSGGTWTAVAKADRRGFAAIVMEFDASSLNFNPATGFLTPAGFEVEESGVMGLRLETVQGDSFSDITFDVGVIGGTYPSTYVDNPGLVPFGANPDFRYFHGWRSLGNRFI